MHEYAIFGHDRSAIGRWIGAGAIVISGGLAHLVAWAENISGWEAFSKATITTGIVYWVLHYIFNKYAWKFLSDEIPDISGKWLAHGRTLAEDGSTRYEWCSEIGIEQNWKTILIHQKTKHSQSVSYTATILKKHGPTGGWLLSYSYRNEPEISMAHELNSHKGYCEIDFDTALKIAQASYFNSGGRRSFGTIELSRIPQENT
ncbi:MAG: hypothetical protein WAO71_05120 [Gallionella sp.]